MKLIKGNFSNAQTPLEQTMHRLQGEGLSVKENSGAKYSEMLINLVKPFMDPEPDADELAEALELGIIAWNMANVKSTGYPGFEQMLENVYRESGISKEEKTIIKRMMYAKKMQYGGDMNFIKEYELVEGDNDMIHVNIISETFADFMASDADEIEILEEKQFEEGYINRNALLVKPRPPFWDWVKQIVPDFEQNDFFESNIYLIEEKSSAEDTTAWLKKNFDKIFIYELQDWTEDESEWPKKRNYKMFIEFFEVGYHSMVMDLEKMPVTKD